MGSVDDVIEFQRLKAVAKRTICTVARQSWREYCTTLNDGIKLGDVWKMANKFSGVSTGPTTYTLKRRRSSLDGRKSNLQRSAVHRPSVEFRELKEDIEVNHSEFFANDAPRTTMTDKLNAGF